MSSYTATNVPTQLAEAHGIRFAYRRWGNHGPWYQNHEDFVFETNRFLNTSDAIVSNSATAAAD
jgi:hypothetical protein